MAELANAHGLLTTICCCYGDYPLAKDLFRYIRKYRFPQHLQTFCPNWKKMAETIALPPAERAYGILRPEIQEMLANSRFLVVICTDKSIKDGAGRNYLRACVSYFLEHQPHSSEKSIIPLLSRESTATHVRDCLLPEFREMNLLAPDMLVKGRNHIFNDVVATLAGLDPDLLWNRWQQKQASRHRRLLLKCGMLFGMAPLAFYFKQWQTDTQLYADYTFRNGEPVGVCPVNKSEASRMHRYYRLTSSFGNFQKLEQCDSSGNVSDDDDCLYGYPRPAVIDIVRAEDKQLIFRNATGEVLRTLSFRGTQDVYLFEQDIRPASSFPELMTDFIIGSALSDDGEPMLFQQQKDENGYLTEAHFRHIDGTPLHKAGHCIGVLLTRNPAAEYRVAELRAVLAPSEERGQENISVFSNGMKQVQHFLKTRKNQTAEKSETPEKPSSGNPRSCRYLYRLVVNRTLLSERLLHDEKLQGDTDECRTHFFWNSDMNLVMELVYNSHSHCLRRTVYDYDASGHRISVRHYSQDNEPILHEGWHEKRYTYTADGKEQSVEVYTLNGKAISPNQK